MLTIAQLRKPLTRAEAATRITELLTALGFDTTGWQDGRVQKTWFNMFAVVFSDLTEVVKAIVEFGSNVYASGDALHEYSRSRFQNEVVRAVRTSGPMTLRSTASIPYTIDPGSLIASTDAGVQFRNVHDNQETLPAGSVASPATLVLNFEALVAGAQGNVPLNSVRRLLKPLAGVTIANDQGTPWYSIAGADQQSDEVLRRRNETKWASLTVELVAESYENIALNHGAKKVKVNDTNPRGAGTIDVYSAEETALLGDLTMQAIQVAFSERAFQTDSAWSHPWPPGNLSRVANRHPPTVALDVTATLYHDPNQDPADIVARGRAALLEFLRVTPIGGWDYSPGPANVVTREELVDRLKDVDGVKTVVTSFATLSVGTLALVIEGTWTITAVPVTA